MARSVRQYTQEAAIGALQNITAGRGAVRQDRDLNFLKMKRNYMYLTVLTRTIDVNKQHQMVFIKISRPVVQTKSNGNTPHISDVFSVAWQMNEAITFTIVQRENGLQHVKKMLEEGESNVKRTAIALIRNLSRYQDLHPDIGNCYHWGFTY